MNKTSILGVCIIALVAFVIWTPDAGAYGVYQTANGALDNCSLCHPGFDTFAGPLHSAHQSYALSCQACHTTPGSIPVSLGSSGSTPGLGCSGCHEGGGLQLHHTNAGVPSDSNGLTCAMCHPGATSPPESTPPAYYGTALTPINNPCQATPAPPGEDFGGGGLDNDGDLLYNENDPDCQQQPECTVDADCDDGDFCNGAETCDTGTGTCVAGTPPDCDDGNLCTTDGCDPTTGCTNVPVECPAGETCDTADGVCKAPPGCEIDADCDDGVFCNGAETCNAGTCEAGTPPTCDDGVACTLDTCDAISDTCANIPDDTFCDDGDFCNGTETCDPNAGCQAGTPPDCDDGNLCTTDSCDVVCVNVPVECPAGETCDTADGVCKAPPGCEIDADCDDGVFCNGAETCNAGTCEAGTPPTCDDGVDCTLDTCDAVSDTCANIPDDTVCPDDGLFCTGEPVCDPAAGCTSTGDPCPAGQVCNEGTDQCDTVVVDRKVTICHIPPGKRSKAKTLRVGAKAVRAHLAHGDYIGPCK